MNSKERELKALSELVLSVSIPEVEKLILHFEELLKKISGVSITTKMHEIIKKSFYFSVWTIVNGVWSNLENAKLRRDLMFVSMKIFVIYLARETSTTAIATNAVNIELDEFDPYVKNYNSKMLQNEKDGIDFNINSSLIFSIEWIQGKLGISDTVLNILVPQLFTKDYDFLKIEELAYQTLKAQEDRKKTWSK